MIQPKYLSLDGLLENPTLRDVIGRQFTEPDLVKIGFLAGACEKLMQWVYSYLCTKLAIQQLRKQTFDHFWPPTYLY